MGVIKILDFFLQARVYKAMERLAASRVKPAARLMVDVVQFQEAV